MEPFIFTAVKPGFNAIRLLKITSHATALSFLSPVPRIPLFCLALILLALIFPGHIRADHNSGINFELLSPPLVDVVPRQMLITGIRLTNTSQESQTFNIKADTPPGWLYSAMPDAVVLEQNESSVVFVSVTIPPDALAGNYGIILNLFPDGVMLDPECIEIGVTVAAVAHIDVSLPERDQPLATTGDIMTRTFRITNLGNSSDHVAIQIESNKTWHYDIDPPELDFSLEPGERRDMTVNVAVPNELPSALTYHLTVIAGSFNTPDAPKSQASMSARIVPRNLTGSAYATLEGDLQLLTALHNGSDSSSIFSLGPMHADLGDERNLGLELRNILLDGDTSGSFIQRQWIWAEYVDENEGYLRVGDLSLDLESPLVERYVSGRGAEAFMYGGPYSLRVFHARTRGSTPGEDTGLQLGFELGDTGIVRLTALQDSDLQSRYFPEDQKEESTNLGLYAEYAPSEGAEFTGELGQSNGEICGTDTAWRFTGNMDIDHFSASCEWLRAGDDYRGGWNDTELRRMNLWWNPVDDFSVWALYSLSWNNIDDDPDTVGRHTRNTGFGMSWNIEDFARLRYTRRTTHNWDNILGTFNRLTHVTVYSLTRSWDGVSTTASLEQQDDDHRVTGEYDTTNSLRFNLSARLNRDANLRLSYSHGRFSRAGETGHENVNDFILGSQLRLSDNIRTSLNLRRNTGGILGNRTDLYGIATWEFSRDHSLSFRIRDYTGNYGGDTEVALEYTQPVGIPIGMFPSKGNADGRVYMLDDPSRGLPNVKITVGSIDVFTDDDGRFSIPVLDPGRYQLSIDPATLGIGYIPMTALPLDITVAAGSTAHIDIPVSKSGQIEGQVFIHTPPFHGHTESTWPMAEITVDLEGSDGSWSRITDSYGHFLFADLIPGSYLLSVREQDIPGGFEILAPQSYELYLVPGHSSAGVDFIISPLGKEITISVDKTGLWWDF